jgi:hypothetical protein
MIAYFSSKLSKQAKALLAASLLMICMVGTNWIGFSHSVSHAAISKASVNSPLQGDLAPTLSHGSDVCHLFDALTLASFLPTSPSPLPSLTLAGFIAVEIPKTSFVASLLAAYRSQAPPSLIL